MAGAACPGCGTETEWLTLRYGSGADVVIEVRPAWCNACLQAKIRAARGVGACNCAEPVPAGQLDFDGHRHAS